MASTIRNRDVCTIFCCVGDLDNPPNPISYPHRRLNRFKSAAALVVLVTMAVVLFLLSVIVQVMGLLWAVNTLLTIGADFATGEVEKWF